MAICNKNESCINHNGWLSRFFSLEKGVRQGCPLSGPLFIIGIEILAIKIRQNFQINGIKLPCKEYPIQQTKISMYADDITLFLADITSVTKVFETIDLCTTCSGLS